MSCKKAKLLLNAYIDNELSERQQKFIKQHIDQCMSCHTILNELLFVKNAVSGVIKLKAPDELKDRISGLTELVKPEKRMSVFAFVFQGHPVASFASAAAVLIVITSVFFFVFSKSSTADIVKASADCHSRSLSGAEKMQFNSQNPDQVKEWLTKQLNIPVILPEFQNESHGHLVGSTVSKIMGLPAGIIKYKKNGSYVTLMVFKIDPNRFTRSVSKTSFRIYNGRRILCGERQSCRIILWRNRNIVYSAVSKMPHERLVRFIPKEKKKS
ncbi:MAG: anti-sigma factor [Candidatus Theseobacter exili]|nr:anti-sigma factor [Candidatus Theseobacter exili]